MKDTTRFRHSPHCIYSIDVCSCGADEAEQEWANTQLDKFHALQDKVS